MKEWWQRRCYFASLKLLKWSGSAGARSWTEAVEMKEFAMTELHRERVRRHMAEGKLRDLLDCAERVDAFISSDMPIMGQAQLRVGIINAR